MGREGPGLSRSGLICTICRTSSWENVVMGLVLTLQREKSFDLVGGVSKLYFILFSSLMKLHSGSGNLSLPRGV